jgi:hypothetical protein
MDKINELSDFFNKHFTINNEYSGREVRLIFELSKEFGISIPNSGNPMAFTYNRWNLGMNLIFPVFHYVGDSIYQYIGPNSKYSGAVFHHPQNTDEELYLIAQFHEGVYTFIDDSILTLELWKKSKKLGERIISVGCFVMLVSKSGLLKCRLVSQADSKSKSTNGYGHINVNSKIGQLLIYRKKNDSVNIGENLYFVEEIFS